MCVCLVWVVNDLCVHGWAESDHAPRGGAARFATMLKSLRSGGPSLLLFSGDALNPSRLSTLTRVIC